MSPALHWGDPALAFEADLGAARRTLADWSAPDERQEGLRRSMLAFIDAHPLDAHRRSCREGHLTASGLIVDAQRRRALLTHHKKLGLWLQLGGHLDGNANLAAGALREACEESGIAGLSIDPVPIDLDIHAIPARPGEPEHRHLDVRFAIFAPHGARPIASQESHELRWFSPEELATLATDDSVRRLFRLVLER